MVRIPVFVLATAGCLLAQNRSVIPPVCTTLPGNAAMSMPLRWSHGTLQIRLNANLLPAGFVGRTISGLRLRRPTFLGEPAYGPLQRTLTVRGGFQPEASWQMVQTLAANRPAGLAVLFGPAVVTVAATAAPGVATATGQEFVHVPFTTPLPVVAGNLFLEFVTSDAPLQVVADHWVDAIWFENSQENGYAVTVGDGSCTTRAEPTELRWDDPLGPRVGQTAALRLTGAPPTAGGSTGWAVAWFGIGPEGRAASATFAGFGASLGGIDPGLAACRQWAPIDASQVGTTDAGGSYRYTFPLAANATTIGMRIGVQAAWLDPSRSGLPLSVSNGVMLVLNSVAAGDRCAAVFCPGSATVSPWTVYFGMMPVVILEHD